MNGARRGALALSLAALSCCPSAGAQSAGVEPAVQHAAQVSFQFERHGVPVPSFTLRVNEDGSGVYDAEDASNGSAVPVHREFQLAPAMTAKIFRLAHEAHVSPATCASKAKNVADTGTKTLTYAAANADPSACTYNYSDNREVSALTEIFQGIAETMDEGRRLDYLHRFDRLGLDEAMTTLVEQVGRGEALEVQIIAPTLRSIADDADVMARVRAKARTLLASASGASQAG